MITGCNVENATYGLTICAERVAMFKALSEGHRTFRRVAIVADTEEEAWARAEAILAKTEQRWDTTRRTFGLDSKNAVGSQRLLEYAAQGDVHDKRLWTAIAKVTGATGNSTALVGSYEQVAESLLDYVDLGVSTLLIRGFEPLADAYRYGRLISLVRAGAAGARTVPVPA